jgi:hypothetical protein
MVDNGLGTYAEFALYFSDCGRIAVFLNKTADEFKYLGTVV